MECPKHTKYKGVRKPLRKTNCVHCWAVWLNNHKSENVPAGDILAILDSIYEEIKALHMRCGDIADIAHRPCYCESAQNT